MSIDTKKIIVTEDIMETLKGESGAIDLKGFGFFTVKDNNEILRAHRAGKADLIITRLDAGDMTGEKLCTAIRKNPMLSNVSIIMLYPDDEASKERAVAIRANEVLPETVSARELAKKMTNLLSIPRRMDFGIIITVEVGDQKHICRLVNLSSTGLLFETEEELNKGDSVTCSFILPRTGKITAQAEIMRIVERPKSPSHYGVKFQKLHVGDRRAIEEYIKKMSR